VEDAGEVVDVGPAPAPDGESLDELQPKPRAAIAAAATNARRGEEDARST
jgi:hypothetical protein